jgi:hypothetical protein
MADSKSAATLPACPRCGVAETAVVANSPVEGAWRMFLCPICFYSWRSTEPDHATTPDGIAPGFRVDARTLQDGKVMPAIPSLRGDSAKRT